MLTARLAAASALILLLAPAAAQKPKQGQYRDVELCNGAASPDTRIEACSAFTQPNLGGPASLAVAYNNRGVAYAEKSDYDRAVADFESAMAVDPGSVKPVNNRGAARLRKGEYDAAIGDFDRVVDREPTYAKAFANRAEALLKKGERARAEADYLAAVRLNDDLEGAWSGLCWIRASAPDPDRAAAALEACDKAISSGSHTAATYDSRALAHLKAGHFDAALADYDAALRIDPHLATALYGRGLTKIRRGDVTGGEADLAAAKGTKADIADELTGYGLR